MQYIRMVNKRNLPFWFISLVLFPGLYSTNHELLLNFTTGNLGTYLTFVYTYACTYVCMLIIYMHIYTCMQIRKIAVLSLGIHTTCWASPYPSLPICAPQCFPAPALPGLLRHPLLSLSSASRSLAIPPGGCSARKFVLSYIFTIALQFTFTKINSPTWNFCNQQRDQNKQMEKESRQQFSRHVNCTLRVGVK